MVPRVAKSVTPVSAAVYYVALSHRPLRPDVAVEHAEGRDGAAGGQKCDPLLERQALPLDGAVLLVR
eukprot:3214736-Pyramimonas_sp.AAC.1